MDKTIKLRVGTSELEQWKIQAHGLKMSLSAWIRYRCRDVILTGVNWDETARNMAQPVDSEKLAVLYVDAENPAALKFETAMRKHYKASIQVCQHGTERGHFCFDCKGTVK